MEYRRVVRSEVKAEGRYRYGAGLALPVIVKDLTEFGCQLGVVPRSLGRGDIISLRIGSIGPIEAEVRWVDRSKGAGLEFMNPLHPSVFSHVVEQTGLSVHKLYNAEIARLRGGQQAGASAAERARRETAGDEPAPRLTPRPAPKPAPEPALILDRRSQARQQKQATATVLDEGQVPIDVAIVDLSDGGCRFYSDAVDLKDGARIALYFADKGLMEGRVQWHYSNFFGIELTGTSGDPAGEPVAQEPDAGTAEPADGAAIDLCGSEGIKLSLSNLPEERLRNLQEVLEAARNSDFHVVNIRIEQDSINLIVAADH